jgi:hypothetical protein
LAGGILDISLFSRSGARTTDIASCDSIKSSSEEEVTKFECIDEEMQSRTCSGCRDDQVPDDSTNLIVEATTMETLNRIGTRSGVEQP